MFKKFLSIILAVSLMLTLAFAVNTAASTTSYAQLDLTSKNIGDAVTTHGGYGTSAIVVSEDDEKAVLIAKNQTEYDLNGTTKKLLNYTSVSGSDFLSASNPKGIVFESTLKITSSSDTVILTTNASNVNPRYLTLNAGNVKYNTTFGSGSTATGVTYPVNSWFTIKLAWNMTTGYMEISVKDLSTGTENKKALTDANWTKSASDLTAVKAFSWYLDGSGYVYIRTLSVLCEDDAAAIAPSRVLIRDNFDNNTDTLTGWSGSGTVAATDRGKSALVNCATAETKIYKTVTIPSDVNGLVSEFSVKLSSTGGTEFIYAADNGDWYAGGKRLLQFTSGGKITAFNGALEARNYKADTWYDVRIETNFTTGFTRISISDGVDETVLEAVYAPLATTYATPSSVIKRLEFVSSSATSKSVYIDDINIFWLDETEVSGLKNPKTYTLHNEFENFAEGNMQEDLIADVTCDATKSFKVAPVEDNFEVGIESVANSGRGKSFKASNLTGERTYEFYKDFLAIQNGVIEFDMMLPEKDGVILIENQVSNKDNGNMSYVAPFRFKADGTITGGMGGEAIGSYEENKWYHISLTSGTYEIDGENNTAILAQIYDSGELVCENTVRTDEDGVSRDSIRNVKISLAEGTNTVYVDNFRVYPSAGVQGIYPTPSRLLREKTIAPDGELIIPFSKVVDLTKSKFKVNGEEVSAVLLGGNVAKLNKTITTGEEYEIEYTATDLDGFTTKGYIGGIKALKGLITEDFTAATMDSPTASVKVTVNSVYLAKNVQLIVATYNESESRVIDIDITSAAAGTGEQTLTATASTEGAAKIKTFFWDGVSLVPVSID